MSSDPVMNVVLVTPEIPHNTGNLIRLCANAGARLHLVQPLGFQLDNPRLSRAALDYSDISDVTVHESVEAYLATVSIDTVYAATTGATTLYTAPKYRAGDTIMLGPESVGLSQDVIDKVTPENRIRIPMMPANRSINLSNAAAIIMYEMWRQFQFSHEMCLTLTVINPQER